MMPWICAVLPCSAALARQNPSSSYSTCRFLRALGCVGGTAATRRISMKGRRHKHRGIIISHSAYTQSTKHTHWSMHIYNALTNPAHRSSDSWAVCMHTHAYAQSIKTCCIPFHDKPLPSTTTELVPPPLLLKYAVQPKYFPCRSCWIQSPAKATSVCRKNYSKFKARPG